MKFFIKLKLPRFITVIVKIFAPVTFGVYVLHTVTFFYRYVLRDAFVFTSNIPFIGVIGITLGAVLIIFLGASLIDWCRLLIFKITGINKLMSYLGNKLDSVITWICKVRKEDI